MTRATEADLKAASDFIYEWINEEAKLHGTSHIRVVRDALAALIHDQRQAALKEGLTLTVEGLGFKDAEQEARLFTDAEVAHAVAKAPPWDNGPDTTAFERMAIDLRNARVFMNACAGLNPEAIPALVEAAEESLKMLARMAVDKDGYRAVRSLRAAIAVVKGVGK